SRCFFFQADDGIRGDLVTGVQTCALPISMSLLVGAYFALLLYRREQGRLAGWRAGTSRAGGIVGAFAGVLGLSTGPCSVVGCGAPVLPVVGLVFAGLSSGTLALLSGASRVLSAVVLVALPLVVAWLGWQAGSDDWTFSGPPGRLGP